MSEPSKAESKKRSHKILATVDALVGLACVSIIGVLIYLSSHPKVVKEQNLGDFSDGIRTAVVVLAIPALLYLLCSVGLFLRWRWAWWVSLVLNTTFALIVCQDVIADWRVSDSEDVGFAVIVAVAATLHVASPVWRWMRSRRERDVAEPVVSR